MAKRINSTVKGKVGERELAHFLAEHGFPAHRGQQHKGGEDSPDVCWQPPVPIHLECKRTETFSIHAAMKQATADAAPGEIPLVCHRRNRGEWLAILPLESLLSILKQLSDAAGAKPGKDSKQ